jgi:hypothetical protein
MLVLSLVLAAFPALASATGSITAVEAMTATIFQQHQSSFSGIGLRVRLQPPQLVKEISLMPTLEYWRNTSNISSFGIEAVRKDATLGVDACYLFPGQTWKGYAGAGFALHFLSNEVDAPTLGLNDATDSLIKGGVAALGGVTFGLAGRLSNMIELKYHHIPDHSQLKINWGLSYAL